MTVARPHRWNERDWRRFAFALDMKLSGARSRDIAERLDISTERARQLVLIAERRLTWRIWGRGSYSHWHWQWDGPERRGWGDDRGVR